MKDWFVRNACIRIFSEKRQTEIGMLHSELCIESNPCSLLPSKLQTSDRFVEENYFVHMPASKYLLERNVKWNILNLSLLD